MKLIQKLAVFGAAVAALSSTARADVNTVRVGYLPNIVMPQPLVGFTRGEFAKRVPGVKFQAKTYPAGPEVLEALRAGVIDIAYTGPYPPLKAYTKAGDVVLLGGCAKGGTELIVAKNSPIRSVRDLRGKVIGINQAGSTVDAMVRNALLKAGLVPDRDVRLIEVEPAQQADALARGEVHAVSAPAPWPSVAKLRGGRALLTWRSFLDNGNYWAGVYFTTKKFARQNPTLVRRFVAANQGITAQLNKNRTKANAQVLNAWTYVTRKKLNPAVAKSAFATIQFSHNATQRDFERAQDIAAQVGQIRKKGSLNGFIYGK